MSINPPKKRSRADRIRKLKEMLKDCATTSEQDGDFMRILAKFCLEEGVSLRTAKEYVELLRMAEEI